MKYSNPRSGRKRWNYEGLHGWQEFSRTCARVINFKVQSLFGFIASMSFLSSITCLNLKKNSNNSTNLLRICMKCLSEPNLLWGWSTGKILGFIIPLCVFIVWVINTGKHIRESMNTVKLFQPQTFLSLVNFDRNYLNKNVKKMYLRFPGV